MMRWVSAFHIISMVAWFAGLFYLPRLFVYHAQSTDLISLHRFEQMEKRLLYYIMMPAGIFTTLFGLIQWIAGFKLFSHLAWMWLKLLLVLFVWIYHFFCMYFVKLFKSGKHFSTSFYRYFNEIPTLLLIAIVILVKVQPSF